MSRTKSDVSCDQVVHWLLTGLAGGSQSNPLFLEQLYKSLHVQMYGRYKSLHVWKSRRVIIMTLFRYMKNYGNTSVMMIMTRHFSLETVTVLNMKRTHFMKHLIRLNKSSIIF